MEPLHAIAQFDAAPDWLTYIADVLGAEASGMLTIRPDGQQSLLAVGHTDAATIAYRDHFYRLDPLSDLLAARPAGRALVIDTTTHPAYIERRELSQDYLRPHGIDHVAAAHWQEPDGTRRFVGIQRFHGAAPFSADTGRALDGLIHHWRIGNALPTPSGFDDTQASSRRSCDIAAQLNTPLAVVDVRTHLVWCNLAALDERSEIWTALRKTTGRTKSEDTLLRRLQPLVTTCLRTRSDTEALIESPAATWFALAAPLAGKPGLCLLRLTALNGLPRNTRARLQSLYQLTAAEADLAVMLANGDSLERIAEQRAVSVDTVRTQLKMVFKKTGANRQGKLVGCPSSTVISASP